MSHSHPTLSTLFFILQLDARLRSPFSSRGTGRRRRRMPIALAHIPPLPLQASPVAPVHFLNWPNTLALRMISYFTRIPSFQKPVSPTSTIPLPVIGTASFTPPIDPPINRAQYAKNHTSPSWLIFIFILYRWIIPHGRPAIRGKPAWQPQERPLPQAYSVLYSSASRVPEEPPAPALPKGVASVKRRQECIFQSPTPEIGRSCLCLRATDGGERVYRHPSGTKVLDKRMGKAERLAWSVQGRSAVPDRAVVLSQACTPGNGL